MTKEKVIDAYNLVCRINKLEKFIETLNEAERISIEIDYTESWDTDSSYSFTLYSSGGDIDEIKEILTVMTKKLDTLKKQLEEM